MIASTVLYQKQSVKKDKTKKQMKQKKMEKTRDFEAIKHCENNFHLRLSITHFSCFNKVIYDLRVLYKSHFVYDILQ